MSKEIFTLVKPFTYREKEISSLEMREPRVRDLRTFIKDTEKDYVSAVENAIATLSETDNKVIGEMSIKDFGRIKKWFEGFLEDMNADSDD